MLAFAHHPFSIQVGTSPFCQLAYSEYGNPGLFSILSWSRCLLGSWIWFITEKELKH